MTRQPDSSAGQPLSADDLRAVSDLAELAAELTRNGYRTSLSTMSPPCLTVRRPLHADPRGHEPAPVLIGTRADTFSWHGHALGERPPASVKTAARDVDLIFHLAATRQQDAT